MVWKEIGKIVGLSHNEMYGDLSDKLKINTNWNISGMDFLQKFGNEICKNNLSNELPQMENICLELFKKYYTESKSNILFYNTKN